MELWNNNQKITSKNTSINKNRLPVLFSLVNKRKLWVKDSVNLDIGGGRFDIATIFLRDEFCISNMIFDPFNRSKEHNELIIDWLQNNKVDTITASNVLCVIQENEEKIKLLQRAFFALKQDGFLFITVYEGDCSGVGKKTGQDQWQENKKTSEYLNLVKEVFPYCELSGKLIIAQKK